MQLYYIVCIVLKSGHRTKVSHIPMTAEDCQARINKVRPGVLNHRSFVLQPA